MRGRDIGYTSGNSNWVARAHGEQVVDASKGGEQL